MTSLSRPQLLSHPLPRRLTLSASILILALALTPGCDEATTADLDGSVPDAAPGSITRSQVLENLAHAVFLPAAADFATRSAALDTAVAAWAATGGAAGPALDAARTAWREAFLAWQYNELLRAGPAGEPRSFIGGQGLRDRIYSWPTTRPCGIDQNLVAERYLDPTFFTAQLVNVLGLDALEYLLYYTGDDNHCPSQVEINTTGSWAALDTTERTRRRAAYAQTLAHQIALDAEALRHAWASDGGDYAHLLARAGTEGSPYPTARDALEQVFHGLFYLDKISKDLKLAIPTGLSPQCPAATGCPDELEAPWSGLARQSLAMNLRAGRALFVGGDLDAPGFDDLLTAAGAADLALQMLEDFDAAIAALDGDSPALDALITDDLPAAQALYTRVKTITDSLKSRFVVVLDLDVPASGAADND